MKSNELYNNLLISGLDEVENNESETTTAELVTDFFSQVMQISDTIELDSAKRIGRNKPKTVLVKLKDAKSKGIIFKSVGHLKDCRNNNDEKYYINNQLTPADQEKERKYRQMIRYNNNLAGVGKCDMEMRKGELYIDNQLYRQAVVAPSVQETMTPLDPVHIKRVKLYKGNVQRKGGCSFIGYCAPMISVADVREAYTKVTRLNSSATHICCAYRIPGLDFVNLRGYEDKGEHGAGRHMYYCLEEENIYNQAVFVARYYGNKHIGPL